MCDLWQRLYSYLRYQIEIDLPFYNVQISSFFRNLGAAVKKARCK